MSVQPRYFCDDPIALNYNSRATTDNGLSSGRIAGPWTCVHPRYICDDPFAANWVPNRTTVIVGNILVGTIARNSLCQYSGCTDPAARIQRFKLHIPALDRPADSVLRRCSAAC